MQEGENTAGQGMRCRHRQREKETAREIERQRKKDGFYTSLDKKSLLEARGEEAAAGKQETS
jgi:hypothetical protein